MKPQTITYTEYRPIMRGRRLLRLEQVRTWTERGQLIPRERLWVTCAHVNELKRKLATEEK